MRRFTSIFGTLIFVLFILFLVACQPQPQALPPSIEVVTATPDSMATTTASELVEEAEAEPTEEAQTAEPTEEAEEAQTDESPEEADSLAYPAPSDDAYPAPSDDAYPTAENDTDAEATSSETSIDPSKPLDVPAPTDSTKANIGGTLLQQTTQGNQPFEGVVLYLGHLVLDDNGDKAAAGFFEKSSPRTSTNSAGHFLFEHVEPREYVLFFWTPQGSVMLLDPSSGEDMILDLKAGDAINMGPLDYDLTY